MRLILCFWGSFAVLIFSCQTPSSIQPNQTQPLSTEQATHPSQEVLPSNLNEDPISRPLPPAKRAVLDYDKNIIEYINSFVIRSPLQGCKNIEKFLKFPVPEYTISAEQRQNLQETQAKACAIQKKIQKIETGPQYTYQQLSSLKMVQLREVANRLKHLEPTYSVGKEATQILLKKIRLSKNVKELIALQRNKKIRAVGSTWVYETWYQKENVKQVLDERIAELQTGGVQK